MSYGYFEIPSWESDEADVVYADPTQRGASAFTHYSYAIASTDVDWSGLSRRRALTFEELRDWPALGRHTPSLLQTLSSHDTYWPGKSSLHKPNNQPINADAGARTATRLGALELIANIGSGRISANDKDPFPHQLQLQQFMRVQATKVKRLLIADEVGLGKTIEVAMVLRDMLVAEGSLDHFSCLYLTSGGLVADAASKLRSVLRGAMGDQNLVQEVDSLRSFGRATSTRGIHVASTHSARLLTSPDSKKHLQPGVAPRVIVVDESHHCASDNDLTGKLISDRTVTTKTYLAAHQLLSGTFWPESKPPELVVFMSATPFRSRDQFANLLRLLIHKIDGIDAYSSDATPDTTIRRLQGAWPSASIVWRGQDDPTVHSWRGPGTRLFPRIRVVRPHRDAADCPVLADPSSAYLALIGEIRKTIGDVMRSHGTTFGGFAISQLEKKLTSSSLAGACYLLSWCIRHSFWRTKEEFRQDQSAGTKGIRELLRSISQRLADFDAGKTARHADVYLASEDFRFDATSIAQAGQHYSGIYDLHAKMRDGAGESFVADRDEIQSVTDLGLKLLSFSDPERQGVENAKLNWLRATLEKFPESRFLIFTESLQTCAIITSALPKISRLIVGNMGEAERDSVVKEFRDPSSVVRLLVATSAADEGFDLQVANRVVHWDLSASPAVLMQRNGRVVRLGQISDVTSYYLIIRGTHEERRDDALIDRFGELGIEDEGLRLRILGALTEEEEEALDRAVESNDVRIVQTLLSRARTENDAMAGELQKISTKLEEASALSRSDLGERLRAWGRIGLPDGVDFDVSFSKVRWQRPVFDEETHLEDADALVASVERGGTKSEFVFDPEYKVFGGSGQVLAGLRPWTVQRRPGRPTKHRPDSAVDVLGHMACSLGRLSDADFATIDGDRLYATLPTLREAKYLVFVSHPMLEAETRDSARAPYLTFYSFSEDLEEIAPTGSAIDTHALILLLEQEAILTKHTSLDIESHQRHASAGERLGRKVSSRVTLGAQSVFDNSGDYFLPIPIALVAVV